MIRGLIDSDYFFLIITKQLHSIWGIAEHVVSWRVNSSAAIRNSSRAGTDAINRQEPQRFLTLQSLPSRNNGNFKIFPKCEFTSLLSTHLPTHLGAVYLKEDFGPMGEVSLEQMEGSFLGGLSSGDVDFLYLSRDVFPVKTLLCYFRITGIMVLTCTGTLVLEK